MFNKPYQANQLYFSVMKGEIIGEDEDYFAIHLCPIEYWNENKCLPDGCFGDLVEQIKPQEYLWLTFTSHCVWISKDQPSDICQKLSSLGFVYNRELEIFLIECFI